MNVVGKMQHEIFTEPWSWVSDRKSTMRSTTSLPVLGQNMELAFGNLALESSIRY